MTDTRHFELLHSVATYIIISYKMMIMILMVVENDKVRN